MKGSFATSNRTGLVLGGEKYPGNPCDRPNPRRSASAGRDAHGRRPDALLRRSRLPRTRRDTSSGVHPGNDGSHGGRSGPLRWRSTIKPEIGHMKNVGLLGRCFPKGRLGDAMNVPLAGAGPNLGKLLAWLRARLPWRRLRVALKRLVAVLRGGSDRIPLAASADRTDQGRLLGQGRHHLDGQRVRLRYGRPPRPRRRRRAVRG